MSIPPRTPLTATRSFGRLEVATLSASTPAKSRRRGKATVAPDPGVDRPGAPTPDEYAVFIRGVELRDVRLTEAHVHSHISRFDSDSSTVKVDMRAEIQRLPKQDRHTFEAVATLDLTAVDAEGGEQARITVTYALRYDGDVEPTDGMLDIFRNLNVSVNVWPYLREYVQQTVTRFGWTPLVLPSLKTLRT